VAHTMKIRKGDVVQILSGKDRGKQGRVLEARPKERRVIVENLNVVKRHMRPRILRDSNRMGQQQVAPGGVVDKAAPLPIATVMVVCPNCERPTRVGIEFRDVKGGEQTKAHGEQTKVRVCKRADCGQVIDR
jgi:large subunit ribosomal protein L24